LRAPDAIA
jgi:hypothetical protein